MTAPSPVTIPTTEPCPEWCQEAAGHPFVDETGTGEFVRWHRAWFGEVEVTQLEDIVVDGEGVGTSTDGPRVCIRDHNGQVVDLIPGDLDRIMPQLRRALSLLA